MLFRDFDILLASGEPDPPKAREINLRSRAFVEAVITELRQRRPEAPWIKLYIDIGAVGKRPYFWPASPKHGLSAAGAHLDVTDRRLLATTGVHLRPLLAEAVERARPTIREATGWDDPWFWELISRVGSHVGPYRQHMKPVTDRKTKMVYGLTYEWDEVGTRVFVDARRGPDEVNPLGRVQVGEFPAQWEMFLGRVPSTIRLVPNGIDLRDPDGVIQTIPRPTAHVTFGDAD